MKIQFLLSIMLMMFGSYYINAQSHISTGKYACQLVPKSLGYEKYSCPACAANDLKVKQAKAAEDKRRTDAAIAKANADKAARDLAYKKAQKEREEKNKVTEVGLAMPSDASLPNSTSNTENTNSNSISETPVYTPTYIKQDVTNQVINQAATLAGGLINDWNASYERKMAKLEAESHASTMARLEKEELKYNTVYLPLMDVAKKGDENARMILFLTSKIYRREFTVPLRDQWLEKAYNNNNIDAILIKSWYALNNYEKDGYEKAIAFIEKAANMGSVDAMMMLASWYDMRTGHSKGGEDPKKALEWYSKAAANGCPNAMYKLGMIYKYGITQNLSDGNGFKKKWHVKYDVVPDEKEALTWFTKSLQPDYVESIYCRNSSSRDYGLGLETSYFNRNTYKELAEIYNKGKVVPKDKIKAKEFEWMFSKYENIQPFNYIK